MGIASLVLGILSLVAMILMFAFKISFGAIPSVMAIVGIVLGIMDIKNNKNKMAITGLILCAIYFIIFIFIVIRSVTVMRSQLL